jgi:hypothetical protein
VRGLQRKAQSALPPEFHATQVTIAQQSPYDSFGIGRVAAERAGRVSFLSFAHA